MASELDSTKKVLTVEYYCAKKNRPLTEFEALIDLEIKLNVDMGRVLHCRKTGLAIIEQISNQMKHRVVKSIIENGCKISLLIDEATRIGNRETVIIFIKASVDGIMEPKVFPIDLIELNKSDAQSIKNGVLKCLSGYGLCKEILKKQLVGFCSGGANIMLGSKSSVGMLLKQEFPNIFLWHCLNQAAANYVPRAGSGPPNHFIRPARQSKLLLLCI